MLIYLLIWWNFTVKLLQNCSISAAMQNSSEAGARKGKQLLKIEIWSDLPRREWKRGDGMFWIPCSHTFSWRKGPDTCRIGNVSSLSLLSEPIETSPCEICPSVQLEAFRGKHVWQSVRRKLFNKELVNWRQSPGIGKYCGKLGSTWIVLLEEKRNYKSSVYCRGRKK